MWKKVSAGIFLAFVLASQISYFPPRAGAGGGSSVSYTVTRTSGTVLTLPATTANQYTYCGASTTPGATVTLTSGTGLAYVAMMPDCTIRVTTALVAACSAGCTTEAGSGYNAQGYPLGSWSATANVWDGSASTTLPQIGSGQPALAMGTNMSEVISGGVRTISASGSPLHAGPLYPFSFVGGNALQMDSANRVTCAVHAPTVTKVWTTVDWAEWGAIPTSEYASVAVYNSDGTTLIAQTNTVAGQNSSNARNRATFSAPPTLSVGTVYQICITGTANYIWNGSNAWTTTLFNVSGNIQIGNTANNSTGTSTLTFPATTGGLTWASKNLIILAVR